MADKRLTKANGLRDTVRGTGEPHKLSQVGATPAPATKPAIRPKTGNRFVKGQSGNPTGRPKTAAFTEEVRAFLREGSTDKTRLRSVLLSLQENDPKVLLYYAFGKPIESVEISGVDGSAIQVERILSDAELNAIAAKAA